MNTGNHQESGLAKSVWTDADFTDMGWHDVTIHGLSVQRAEHGLARLLLDLDYIVRWVHPTPPETHFSFWISPATLVFEEVFDLEGDLDFTGQSLDLDIDAVHRLALDDARPGFSDVPLWHLEGHAFDLKFRATGYRQYVRQAPRLTARSVLPQDERGGCAFTEIGFG